MERMAEFMYRLIGADPYATGVVYREIYLNCPL